MSKEQELVKQSDLDTQSQQESLNNSEEKTISEEPWFDEFWKFQCGDCYRSFEEMNPDLDIRS